MSPSPPVGNSKMLKPVHWIEQSRSRGVTNKKDNFLLITVSADMVREHAQVVKFLHSLKYITLVKYVSHEHKQDTGTDLE